MSDFIIDTLLGSPSETVRQQAADHFFRLSKIRLVSRSLALSPDTNHVTSQNSPKHFLIQVRLTITTHSVDTNASYVRSC